MTRELRGPDDRDYEVTLSASLGPAAAASGDALRMSFQLRDPGALDLPAPAGFVQDRQTPDLQWFVRHNEYDEFGRDPMV